MSIRMIDYYIKGLPMDIRQEIFRRIHDVNIIRVYELMEKTRIINRFMKKGILIAKSLGYCKIVQEIFAAVNEVMAKNGRPPLFMEPTDTYESSKRYLELLERKDEETIAKYFGYTWEKYIPESNQSYRSVAFSSVAKV